MLQRRVGAGANLPSKIGPYLASGRPVVASIDPTTPAAALLAQRGRAYAVRALGRDAALRRLEREFLSG